MNAHAVRSFVSKTVLTIAAAATLAAPAQAADEVNVYSYRQPFLVKPLFDGFTADTGIKVNVIFAKKGLIERMAQEGEKSPADVLLTIHAHHCGPTTHMYIHIPPHTDVHMYRVQCKHHHAPFSLGETTTAQRRAGR